MTTCDLCTKPCPRHNEIKNLAEGRMFAMKELTALFKKIDNGTLVEVRHARWINDGDEYFQDIKCERCGQRKPILLGNFPFNYCPNCGAKMDGGADDADD